MRALLITGFAIIAVAVSAEDNFTVVLTDVEDAHGNRVQFRADTNTLAHTPDWSPGAQDPPLSIAAATRIALEAGKRRVPKADNVVIESITLQKREAYGRSAVGLGRLIRWFYLFRVSPTLEGDTFKGTAPITVVVLLDGSVVEPSPVK